MLLGIKAVMGCHLGTTTSPPLSSSLPSCPLIPFLPLRFIFPNLHFLQCIIKLFSDFFCTRRIVKKNKNCFLNAKKKVVLLFFVLHVLFIIFKLCLRRNIGNTNFDTNVLWHWQHEIAAAAMSEMMPQHHVETAASNCQQMQSIDDCKLWDRATNALAFFI